MSDKVIDTWLEVHFFGTRYGVIQMVLVKDDKLGEYVDVQQTGFGRYKTRGEAETEMRFWSESDRIRIGYAG